MILEQEHVTWRDSKRVQGGERQEMKLEKEAEAR